MDFSPQSVTNKTFEVVKKGYEPLAVKRYLSELAAAIEASQNEAAAMEARARAAVARLQDLTNQQAAAPRPVVHEANVVAGVSEAETISRTLLLAQRTADTTRAEAEAESARMTDDAREEASKVVEAARVQAGKLLDDAKTQARQAGEGERQKMDGEVQSLIARREFLVSDVEHLEQHIITHRERLRDVVGSLQDIIGKVPGGLADLRRPLVSAAGDSSLSMPSLASMDEGSMAPPDFGGESATDSTDPAEADDLDPDATQAMAMITLDPAMAAASAESAHLIDEPVQLAEPAADAAADDSSAESADKAGSLFIGGDSL